MGFVYIYIYIKYIALFSYRRHIFGFTSFSVLCFAMLCLYRAALISYTEHRTNILVQERQQQQQNHQRYMNTQRASITTTTKSTNTLCVFMCAFFSMEYPNGNISSTKLQQQMQHKQLLRVKRTRIESCICVALMSSLSCTRAAATALCLLGTAVYMVADIRLCRTSGKWISVRVLPSFVCLTSICLAVTTLRTAHTWILQRYHIYCHNPIYIVAIF